MDKKNNHKNQFHMEPNVIISRTSTIINQQRKILNQKTAWTVVIEQQLLVASWLVASAAVQHVQRQAMLWCDFGSGQLLDMVLKLTQIITECTNIISSGSSRGTVRCAATGDREVSVDKTCNKSQVAVNSSRRRTIWQIKNTNWTCTTACGHLSLAVYYGIHHIFVKITVVDYVVVTAHDVWRGIMYITFPKS